MISLARHTRRAELAATAALGPSDLLALWLEGRKETTVRAYRADLLSWASWMGCDPSEAIETLLSMDAGRANAVAMAYRAELVGSGLSPATINRRIAALRSLTEAARTVGLVGWALSIRGVKGVAYRDTRGPGLEGYRAMAATLGGDDVRSRRDRALLALLYTMCLRRAEAIGLNLEDLDLVGRRAWILGKGRTEREAVSIPSPTVALLRSWLEVRGEKPGPLFYSLDRRGGWGSRPTLNAISRRVREIAEAAGLSTSPHGLRHAGITRALDLTGGDARRVRALSRHAKLETLMLYDDARRDLGGEIADLLAAEA
jgi:integrase/recombinase XerC